jgi:hypothetical protein
MKIRYSNLIAAFILSSTSWITIQSPVSADCSPDHFHIGWGSDSVQNCSHYKETLDSVRDSVRILMLKIPIATFCIIRLLNKNQK